ncbi:MAG: pyridoxal phosphate-dependent aminotransferase [Paracoccaceae bacterium]|nr:pyridoxal phosphate-dependent aminotransferase [Paracoccaceae bacterium]
MAFLSATLERLGASPTVAMSNRAAALKAEGRDLIALAAGEPDFDTPAHIRAAAIEAMERGETRYTAVDGTPALKAAIAAKFERDNDLAYGADEITVGAGGKHVIWNALLATLGPGDEAIVPAPYWVSYPDMVRFTGATPVIVPAGPEQRFLLTADALAGAITDRTKWLILNSPSNPTGAGYRADDLAALAEVLRRHPEVHVLADDIYEHIAFPGFEFATMAEVAPDLKARVLTVNGVSKAYAMTGWRIGFACGPAPLIAAIRKLQSQSTTNPSSISQAAAAAALTGPQDYLAEARAAFLRRRDVVVAALNGMPGVTCDTPVGAFYVYPSVAGLIGRRSAGGRALDSDEAVAEALLEEAGVAVVFGAAFGLSPHIRISYAAADDELAKAMARIAEFAEGCR